MTINKDSPPRALKKKPGRFHHGDLKEALVIGTSRLIAERKEVDFTLREIAQKVGVSHVAVFNHFANKTKLLAEVARRGFLALTGALEKNKRSSQAMLESLETYVSFALEHPGDFRAMFHQSLSPFDQHEGLAEAASRAFHCLERAIEREFGEAKHERSLLAWSVAHGLATLAIDNQIAGPFALEPDEALRLIKPALKDFAARFDTETQTAKQKGNRHD
jgi:AcrR family transcriptional regulator